MIRALCTWSLKISAALYVRHFHFLHTIEEAEVLNQNEFDNFDNSLYFLKQRSSGFRNARI